MTQNPMTEKGKRKGRFHHHLIMNGGIDQTELQRIWGKGYIKTAGLVFDENGIATLVGYMLKQAREFMGKKKYSRSRNLIVPQAKSRDNRFSQKQVKELARDQGSVRETVRGIFFIASAGHP